MTDKYQHVASLFLGKLLGQGVSRKVYEFRPWPGDYVVKVQTGESYEDGDYQNIAEWALWQGADLKLRQWLAPCVLLGPGGGALLQVRCEPCPEHLIPKKIPKVLGDAHKANFGIHKERVVVTDYGRNFVHRLAANARVMRKVNLDEYTELSTRDDGI